MERLLIIADDFTGALDTGVQFAQKGAVTKVVMDPDFDYSAEKEAQVIVFNSNSRHIPAQEAYDLVFKATKGAMAAGIKYVYKKTDSGLRGNLGAEISAAFDASGDDFLAFVPAFPKMNRYTENGIHYIDGTPVAESNFGSDPIDPVKKSAIADIIHLQAETPVYSHKKGEAKRFPEKGIHVYDGKTAEDLEEIAKSLGKDNLHLAAGCAGFANPLADVLGVQGETPDLPKLPKNFVIVCASVNPVTLNQLKLAEEAGFTHIRLNPVQKMEPCWTDSEEGKATLKEWLKEINNGGKFIIDSNEPEGQDELGKYLASKGKTIDDAKLVIADNVAHIAKVLLDMGMDATLLCTGGDTFYDLVNHLNATAITPVMEVAMGTVLDKCAYAGKEQYVISKSGGFGEPNVAEIILNKIQSAK